MNNLETFFGQDQCGNQKHSSSKRQELVNSLERKFCGHFRGHFRG